MPCQWPRLQGDKEKPTRPTPSPPLHCLPHAELFRKLRDRAAERPRKRDENGLPFIFAEVFRHHDSSLEFRSLLGAALTRRFSNGWRLMAFQRHDRYHLFGRIRCMRGREYEYLMRLYLRLPQQVASSRNTSSRTYRQRTLILMRLLAVGPPDTLVGVALVKDEAD